MGDDFGALRGARRLPRELLAGRLLRTGLFAGGFALVLGLALMALASGAFAVLALLGAAALVVLLGWAWSRATEEAEERVLSAWGARHGLAFVERPSIAESTPFLRRGDRREYENGLVGTIGGCAGSVLCHVRIITKHRDSKGDETPDRADGRLHGRDPAGRRRRRTRPAAARRDAARHHGRALRRHHERAGVGARRRPRVRPSCTTATASASATRPRRSSSGASSSPPSWSGSATRRAATSSSSSSGHLVLSAEGAPARSGSARRPHRRRRPGLGAAARRTRADPAHGGAEGMTVVLIVIGIAVVIGLWAILTYNGMVRARNKVDEAWTASTCS